MKQKTNTPVMPFLSEKVWEAWLAAHQKKSSGIWLQIFKKDSNKETVSYDQALDVALCYGWIDGQKKLHDAESWLQKFTPRRARSVWSQRNKQNAARLIKSKRMRPAGLKEIATAKADGRWGQAYESSSNMTVPSDFLKELAKDKNAHAFFKTLNRANVYSIAWRLQTAKKPETRQKRLQVILEMMKKKQKFHNR
ncbi:MAG: YdeI/OmpD-associated family protein [Pseudorhodoplanes sp.]|nr:YdeI/OmpD-associated family protein [Pseudorhodoplanes sp.]